MSQSKINVKALWRIHRFFRPHLRHWNGDYVLFDELSGDTHALDQLAGYILECLLVSPMSIDSIAEKINIADEITQYELNQLIAMTLSELVNLSFVEELNP